MPRLRGDSEKCRRAGGRSGRLRQRDAVMLRADILHVARLEVLVGLEAVILHVLELVEALSDR